MLEDIKAVIFDLDGTLVDSMWMWKEIDIEFLSRYGHECPEDLQKAIEGMSFTETAGYFKNRFELPLPIEEIKDIWIGMSIDKYRNEVFLKPGAKEFLEHLRENDLKIGIATSNGRDMVDAVLSSLGVAHYFHRVTTACEVAAGKPSPDIYLEVAQKLHVEPSDCLVFEDIPAGITAGKRAGMKVCAVEDAFSLGIMEEKKNMADFYIKDYRDLLLVESPPPCGRRTEVENKA